MTRKNLEYVYYQKHVRRTFAEFRRVVCDSSESETRRELLDSTRECLRREEFDGERDRSGLSS